MHESRKAAIEADIYASGGAAAVGVELGLSADPKTAATLISNKLNRNGRHEFKEREVWQIKQWARQRAGRSQLHELECAELKFEGHWLTVEEIKAQRKKERQALLRRLAELEEEDA